MTDTNPRPGLQEPSEIVMKTIIAMETRGCTYKALADGVLASLKAAGYVVGPPAPCHALALVAHILAGQANAPDDSDHWLGDSAEILAALTAAGYVVVPREPTQAMVRAGLQEALEKAVAAMARLDEKLAASEGETPHDRRYLLALLECALGEYADAGLVILPREPDEAMLRAGSWLDADAHGNRGSEVTASMFWDVMVKAFLWETYLPDPAGSRGSHPKPPG